MDPVGGGRLLGRMWDWAYKKPVGIDSSGKSGLAECPSNVHCRMLVLTGVGERHHEAFECHRMLSCVSLKFPLGSAVT